MQMQAILTERRSEADANKVRSRFCSLRPAPPRPIEEGRLLAWSSASSNPLQAGNKTGLTVMFPANLGDQRLPLLLEPSTLVASPGLLKVRQRRVVVLALTRIDN